LVKLPIVEGPSAAFDGLLIGFGKAGQLAMATTGDVTPSGGVTPVPPDPNMKIRPSALAMR